MIAKLLYEAGRGDPDEPLLCPKALLTPLNLLKQTLSRTPALSISNPNKIIHLYLHSDKGQTLGLMAQSAGDSIASVAYLSK
jgi:hypothetical protein